MGKKNAELYADIIFVDPRKYSKFASFFGYNFLIITLFAYFNANAKKLYIFKHFAKSKTLVFAKIYHSPFDAH
jgi:hypothetical protein